VTVPRARGFLALTAIQVLVLAGLMAWARSVVQVRGVDEVHGKRELVRRLELTDLAIWTEARYTRHPSQADFFAPFQDGPSSLEHFPAGSVVAAPDLPRAAQVGP
jgi:hypothetical protein